MEEICLAATAYYNNCSNEIRQLALEFFQLIDTDQEGRVSFNKFTNFFQTEEWTKYFDLGTDGDDSGSQECAKLCKWVADSKFFTQLDTNGDGSVDFSEFLSFFYLLSTRHVWCSGCQANLPGLYFTCLDCFDCENTTYDLCVACYNARRFSHHHSRFLDSFVLLRSKTRRGVSRAATASSINGVRNENENGQEDIDCGQNNNGKDLFHKPEVVRLRSYHKKYLLAHEDQESVIQSRNGSSENAAWSVELVPGSGSIIYLKSCYGKYLTASDEPFRLRMTSKKVLQTLPINLDSSIEWEPKVKDGNQVLLKNRHGCSMLRANAGLPPWRNKVTHQVSSKSSNHDWMWYVDIVEKQQYQPQSETSSGQQKFPAREEEDANRATRQVENFLRLMKLAVEVVKSIEDIASTASNAVKSIENIASTASNAGLCSIM